MEGKNTITNILLTFTVIFGVIASSVSLVNLFAISQPKLNAIDKRTDATYFLLKTVNDKVDSLVAHMPKKKAK